MINGFDEETAPLTEKEAALLPFVIALLETHKGKEKAITSKTISYNILVQKYEKVDGPRIRKIINHIRQNGLVSCLIATSAGYYVAETEQELIDYEESLNGRATAIWQIRSHIQKQRAERFRANQGVLF